MQDNQDDNKKVLSTADIGKRGLERAIEFAKTENIDLSDLYLFDVPHHDSKRNLGKTAMNNMYRTFCSMFVLLILIKLYYFISLKFLTIEWLNVDFLIILLLLMFLFAYRKQTRYITKRINAVLSKD